MVFRRIVVSGMLMLIGVVPACAQTITHLQDTRRPVGSPPTISVSATSAPTTLESQLMPMERIEKPISLDDQLAAMRTAIPEFNSVIVRDDGVPRDYPTLPAMTLKNVTVGQFLQFVQASFPPVQIIRIDGASGALYSIRIRNDENAHFGDQDRLRLYRLNEVINNLASDQIRYGKDGKEINHDEAVKNAMNDVLSLLQAALDQTDPDGPSVLKIHEPTLTLMFKGSRAKQEILEEALATLAPGSPRPFRASAGKPGYIWPDSSLQLTPPPMNPEYLQAMRQKLQEQTSQAQQLEAQIKAMKAKDAESAQPRNKD